MLGLFLGGGRPKALALQLTAFTVAHSLTLALATLGWVTLPSDIVEPLIALSIAYVGCENVCLETPAAQRSAIVFGFGLLHGLGFADALGEIGLPPARFLLALTTFNLGVELGQLAVLALAFALFGWWRRKGWYRMRVARPASCAIALFGCYWLVERSVAAT